MSHQTTYICTAVVFCGTQSNWNLCKYCKMEVPVSLKWGTLMISCLIPMQWHSSILLGSDSLDHLQQILQEAIERVDDHVHHWHGIVWVLQESLLRGHDRLAVLVEAFVQPIGKCLEVQARSYFWKWTEGTWNEFHWRLKFAPYLIPQPWTTIWPI